MLIKWLGIIGFGAGIFGISYHYNQRFLDWLRFQSLGTRDYIDERFKMMFVDVPSHRILVALFLLSVGLGSLVFVMFLPALFPGFLFGGLTAVVGWKAPKPIVDWIYQRRVRTFVLQMVDGLSLMSNGMKSGLSV